MSIGGLFLLLAFLAAVAAIIIWPLFQSAVDSAPDSTAVSASDELDLARLHAQHEAILLAIRDLDFDRQTGKMTHEEYQEQREALVQRGIDTLQQIDAQQSIYVESLVQSTRQVRKTPQKRRV